MPAMQSKFILRPKYLAVLLIFLSFLGVTSLTLAQVLSDRDGNGTIMMVAIGDSLTAGLGDGIAVGADVPVLQGNEFGEGYPGRLTRFLGVPVENEGIPGEDLSVGGISRFPSELNSSNADAVILFEGLNDSFAKENPPELGRIVQRAVNVAKVLGRNMVLATLPMPCCNHAGRESFIGAYSQEIRNVAAVNSLPVADIEKAWQTTCQNREECELFNLPEGLHPNKLGYDVIAQTIAASVLDIDIFAPDGAAKLAAAIGVPVTDIKVKPAVVTPAV